MPPRSRSELATSSNLFCPPAEGPETGSHGGGHGERRVYDVRGAEPGALPDVRKRNSDWESTEQHDPTDDIRSSVQTSHEWSGGRSGPVNTPVVKTPSLAPSSESPALRLLGGTRGRRPEPDDSAPAHRAHQHGVLLRPAWAARSPVWVGSSSRTVHRAPDAAGSR